MKFTTKKIVYSTELQTCNNCGHVYKGKICNQCGEKVFSEKQLTTKHFIHQVIDFFYHWESKVLKTIKLNIFKPGFVTKENLRGVRVPYAKPVQLYLVVAFIFYIVVSKVGVTDYIPSYGDHYFFSLSYYKPFRWLKPVDEKAINAIDTLWKNKGLEIQEKMEKQLTQNFLSNNVFQIYGRERNDSIAIPISKMPVVAYREAAKVRQSLYDHSIGTYAKTFIFILLPVFAVFFFFIFFRKIKYYGASLILATHFMIYNLCIYSIYSIIDILPREYFHGFHGWVMLPFNALFYDTKLEPISTFLFGSTFEFFHLVFWMPWLIIAFRRLFNTVWWKNILISYICSRVFFYLIFGVLKKALIAFTIWSMHA